MIKSPDLYTTFACRNIKKEYIENNTEITNHILCFAFLLSDQDREELENKINFLAKLLQEINSLGDIRQSSKDTATLTGSKSSTKTKNAIKDSGSLPGAFNAETVIINPLVNADNNARTTPGEAADRRHSKLQETDVALIPKEEDTYDEFDSLSGEDKSYISDGKLYKRNIPSNMKCTERL